MKEIKSVRVRRSRSDVDTLDIKVILYESDDGNVYIIQGINSGRIIWNSSYNRNGIYKSLSIDELIINFINTNSKVDNVEYSIIQNPWSDNVPILREYGFAPYYLNNGSFIKIDWILDKSNIGGREYSDQYGNEINTPDNIYKIVKIYYNDISIGINSDGSLKYISNIIEFKKYISSIKDLDILREVVSLWNSKIPKYSLEPCTPNNIKCNIIEFRDPITIEMPKEILNPIRNSEIDKVKLEVILPTEKIVAKLDFSIKILLGKNISNSSYDNYIFDNNEKYIDSEYLENEFDGLDENEFKLQDDIANFEEDSDSNLVSPGNPVDIQPFSNLDQLLRLAGKCARELGKNPRVNYDNLKKGYIKGVHGLCPQGTFSVLYALTGIKKVAILNGNANTFSFFGSNSLSSTGYFNNKIKIDKDYFNDSSLWQVGDIVASDYINGKLYGHIQIWTGYCWMSDFKQNRIQINHVDFNSVALWRLNNDGIKAVQKQNGIIS